MSRKYRDRTGITFRYSFSEDELRKAKPEALERWARWLGVKKKSGRNANEELSFLIYGILRAVKRLEKLPRGTIPSDVKGKL